MISLSMPAAELITDADLVQQSLAQGTPAFSQIVTRYQTLICSLTYHATGSLSRSEDLAQEVFLIAWKELRQLREPGKLRPWLCAIARRLATKTRNRDEREPVCAAEALDDEHRSPAPSPREETISREEEAILWRTLEKIPEPYREPLILFYREGQSVERVAAALEISEDAAKQRLSRGRKLLRDEVTAFVEGALGMSAPGRAFTVAVIATLPMVKTSSAAAATIVGTAAVETSGSAKGLGLVGLLGNLIAPVVSLWAAWIGFKTSYETAESPRERQFLRRQYPLLMLLGILVAFGFAAAEARIPENWDARPVATMVLRITWKVADLAMVLVFTQWLVRRLLKVRQEEAAKNGQKETSSWNQRFGPVFEYRSPWKLLGLPIVHIRTGKAPDEKLRPAVGWVAIGTKAFGLIFAAGVYAVGPVSMGIVSAGLISVGILSAGVLAIAAYLGFGLWGAAGPTVIGYVAHGQNALAYYAATGQSAVAHAFAQGTAHAFAQHANDAIAGEAVASHVFFQGMNSITTHFAWASARPEIAWLPLLLLLWWQRRAARRIRMLRDQ